MKYPLTTTLTEGQQNGIVLDYTSLGLTIPPEFVNIDGPVEMTEPGQENLFARVTPGSISKTQALCDLNAPCDVTGRQIVFTVVALPQPSPTETPLWEFREVIRLLLGDTEIYGCYAYPDADCDSAVRQVFRLGQGPRQYNLTPARNALTPPLPDGDKYAMVAYTAALLLIGGEEGAESFRTRSLTTAHRGERKRDILQEFRQKIYEIETGGGLVFHTYQNLLGALQHISLGAFTEAKVVSPVNEVTL